MSDVTARLDLPLIKPSQAQKHVTHNEALQVLDGLVQAALEEVGAQTPPFEPTAGILFALGGSPTGAWSDQGGKLAYRSGDGWIFIDPAQGWHAWDKASGEFKVYDGGVWRRLSASYENLPGLGIGATSDDINRLSLSSQASLFNHAGAGHQIKVNKAASGETASLLFQSGFTGHAEMGLAGDTSFSIKISDDGNTWFDAFRASATTQQVEVDLPITGTAVQQSPIDDTVGRLLTTGASASVLTGGVESYASVSGSANALNITTGANLASIPPGYMMRFRATAENTAATTIDVDGLGPLPCTTNTGYALTGGYLRTDADTTATYNGTGWVLDRVTERGSNAGSTYLRLADGTQLVQTIVTLTRTSATRLAATVVFPEAFSDAASTTVSLSFEDLTSSTTDIRQLATPRSYNITTTDCTVEVQTIDGFSSLASGDVASVRMLALGSWY